MSSSLAYTKTSDPAPIPMSQHFRDMILGECLAITLDGGDRTVSKIRSSIQNAKVSLESKGDFRRFITKLNREKTIIRVWRIK